jgi:hypothetical protein
MRVSRRFWAVILVLAAVAAAQQSAPQALWQDTGPALAALKQRFNADASRHRLLMLVSPT